MKPPLSANEIVKKNLKREVLLNLISKERKSFFQLWKKTHLDIILRQDLIDLEIVKNVKQIELQIVLLKTSVGSPISCHVFAQDIQLQIKQLEILKDMYVIFKLTSYSNSIAHSFLKMPKYYFYDVDGALDSNER